MGKIIIDLLAVIIGLIGMRSILKRCDYIFKKETKREHFKLNSLKKIENTHEAI